MSGWKAMLKHNVTKESARAAHTAERRPHTLPDPKMNMKISLRGANNVKLRNSVYFYTKFSAEASEKAKISI